MAREKTFGDLRRCYGDAVKKKKEIFEFQKHALLTSYAKYLIEYLESCKSAHTTDTIELIPIMRESLGD